MSSHVTAFKLAAAGSCQRPCWVRCGRGPCALGPLLGLHPQRPSRTCCWPTGSPISRAFAWCICGTIKRRISGGQARHGPGHHMDPALRRLWHATLSRRRWVSMLPLTHSHLLCLSSLPLGSLNLFFLITKPTSFISLSDHNGGKKVRFVLGDDRN